jgi:hypothetical protein
MATTRCVETVQLRRMGPVSGEARANMKGVHLSCGCIYMIYGGCLYGEILIAITEFLNFGGCICTHQLLSSFAPACDRRFDYFVGSQSSRACRRADFRIESRPEFPKTREPRHTVLFLQDPRNLNLQSSENL